MGTRRDFDTPEALLAYAGELGLRASLLAQVIKDFERASVPFPRVGPSNGGEATDGEWVRGLEEGLYRLLMEDFDGYLNLMYAADIPEREFRSLEVTDAVDVARQVALLLLRREWQKVWSRATYDSGRSPQK